MMETAAKVLIVGGVLNLAYGVLTGLVLTNVRMRSPQAPRYLTLAHLGPLMQGPMLLGLAVATGLSSLAGGLETLAACLLVAGSAGIGAGDTLNWLGGVGDAFAERSLGFFSQVAGGAFTGIGLAILIAGVFRGL
jgi:hypothetical protein